MLSNSFHLIGMIPFDRSNLENEIKKKINYLSSTNFDDEKKQKIEMIQDSEDELNRSGNFKRIFPNEKNPFKHHELFDRKTMFNEDLANFEESKKKHSIEYLYEKILH